MKKKLRNSCAECGSTNVIYDREDDKIICQDCGAIFEELSAGDEEDYEEVLDEDVPEI